MATDILTTLEFDRIQAADAHQCQFAVAAEHALELGPSSDSSTVRYLLRVTDEAYRLLEEQPGFGVGGCRDIRAQVERAEIGGVLQPDELLDVAATIAASRSVRRSFRRVEESDQRFPELDEFVGFIVELPGIEESIRRCISDKGEVLDSASDALRTIRQQLRTAHSRLLERINRYLQHAAIQDPLVTQRDGRYVVPVRADRRGQLRGVVHDTSASGQTLYVEPMDVVELNNRWRELQVAERHEIERILTALSVQVGSAASELNRTLEALAAIDLALAKARYASSTRSTRPTISDAQSPEGRRVILRRARHPLLEPATVVPIDLELGTSFRVLVVTGPNTGGKTVALKTLGLLSVMVQSGLFVPADDGCELPVFDGIFADIGDEQSIEQSLSTFSSHMVRVIAMLRSVTSDSLVLLDEMGAGTDPDEGAALARSIIVELLEVGCLAVTTTHYSELKAFAYSTPGAENGSVEFDIKTLSPTYRLIVGIPGQSNALAIARRLGMPDRVIDRARALVDPDVERADELLAEIRERRTQAEMARREAEQHRLAAEALRRDAEHDRAEAEIERESARRDALAAVESELAEARQAIRRIRETPTRVAAEQVRPTTEAARRDLEQATQTVKKTARSRPPRVTKTAPIAVGDQVELVALGGDGEVIGFSPDGDEVDVQMGPFKVRQPLSSIRKIGGRAKPERRATPAMPPPRREVNVELHLRGQRAAGVDKLVDEYLHDAYLSRLPFVRIVHGKGTGALREVVQDVVRRHPLVEKYETPPHYEGGEGVTVVYLRES